MTTWLIDKSALVRLAGSPDASEWWSRIDGGLVRISTVNVLEAGFSARSGESLKAALASPPLARMPVEYLTPAIEDRGRRPPIGAGRTGSSPRRLDPRHSHRCTAELAELTVLHLDRDFELIAELTGQPHEGLATT